MRREVCPAQMPVLPMVADMRTAYERGVSMIELDVDMGYLLEDGEPDSVTLNDENGEFEPMTFYRGNADAVEFCKRVESAVNERKPLTLFGVDYEVVE